MQYIYIGNFYQRFIHLRYGRITIYTEEDWKAYRLKCDQNKWLLIDFNMSTVCGLFYA